MKIFETGELIGKSSRLLTNSLSKNLLLSNTDITPEQWIVLQILSRGPKNQKELTNITLKTKATVNSLVSYLLKADLITKTNSIEDNRKIILAISKKGISTIKQTEINALKSINQATNGFSEKEISELNNYLSRIIENIKTKPLWTESP